MKRKIIILASTFLGWKIEWDLLVRIWLGFLVRGFG